MREKAGAKEPRVTSTSGDTVDQSQDKDALHSLAGRFLLLWVLGCKEWIILIFDNYKHQRTKKKYLISESHKGP